ncbi:MAG: DUF2326 domain-containing protein [candidate division Zixibacteria bacterium]|nr:DUF2326 domain-containing protein [candidate division Zixibacteria bacterium]
MKLCKIYSNHANQFHNIEFHDGLNVILAEISDKSSKKKDTHNLGKTLLISVIDFLMLDKISNKSKYFLTRGGFEKQFFFCEIQLNNGKYLIIGRGVDNPSKISLKRNEYRLQGFEIEIDWDDHNLPIDRAKEKLNEYLEFDVVPSWKYRKAATYFLRSQDDFRNVFKLNKFEGKDKEWKPFIFDLLGFDGEIVLQKYDLEDEKNELVQRITTLQRDADVNIAERDKIKGLLDIKVEEHSKIESKIDRFNFYEKDSQTNKQLVDDIDRTIQLLNTQRYSLSVDIKKTEHSLSAGFATINTKKLQELFKEAKIFFPDNLVHDYDMLMEFNKSITMERKKILVENLAEIKEEFDNVSSDLKKYETEKEQLLSYLTEKDSYSKFKTSQKQFALCEAEIIRLREKLAIIDRTAKIDQTIKSKEHEIEEKIKEIASLIGEAKHSEIRKTFNKIIKQILNTNALLSIKQNKVGNVEFAANIQSPKNLTITAEDYGNTYKKLLCMAFDLSLLIYYSKKSFYRFAYHDGALEALDDRKKIIFLEFIREICLDYNLQYIITLIDSDLPKDASDKILKFPENEICLRLHDESDDGKLFKKSF